MGIHISWGYGFGSLLFIRVVRGVLLFDIMLVVHCRVDVFVYHHIYALLVFLGLVALCYVQPLT